MDSIFLCFILYHLNIKSAISFREKKRSLRKEKVRCNSLRGRKVNLLKEPSRFARQYSDGILIILIMKSRTFCKSDYHGKTGKKTK